MGAAVSGVSSTPAASVEYPHGPRRNCTREKKTPKNAAPISTAATEVDANTRWRNMSKSMTGAGWLRQRARNTARPTAAAANAPMTRGSPIPHSSSWAMPSTSAAVPNPARATPTRSGSSAASSFSDSGMRPRRASTTTPAGAAKKNAARHEPNSMISPPSVGASEAATPATVAHTPTATARRWGPRADMTRASPEVMRLAPPKAWKHRAAIITGTLGANPTAAEPVAKMVMAHKNTARWPTRSAKRPAGMSRAATMML